MEESAVAKGVVKPWREHEPDRVVGTVGVKKMMGNGEHGWTRINPTI